MTLPSAVRLLFVKLSLRDRGGLVTRPYKITGRFLQILTFLTHERGHLTFGKMASNSYL